MGQTSSELGAPCKVQKPNLQLKTQLRSSVFIRRRQTDDRRTTVSFRFVSSLKEQQPTLSTVSCLPVTTTTRVFVKCKTKKREEREEKDGAEEVSSRQVLPVGEIYQDVRAVSKQVGEGRRPASEVDVQEGGEEEQEGSQLLQQEEGGTRQGGEAGAGRLAEGAERAEREGEPALQPNHRGSGPKHSGDQANSAEHDAQQSSREHRAPP